MLLLSTTTLTCLPSVTSPSSSFRLVNPRAALVAAADAVVVIAVVAAVDVVEHSSVGCLPVDAAALLL